MARFNFSQTRLGVAFIALSLFLSSCASSANNRYFGAIEPPKDNVFRYVSGSEPESLDPQIPTGQPEARVLMALYDGLVEYHPKTMDPIPAIAESWEISPDGTEFIFNLRKDAKFSNGAPITAHDFVNTFRRMLSPELAAQNAYLAYEIKYAEPYNAGESFVKDANGQFLLKKDFEESDKKAPEAEQAPVNQNAPASTSFGLDTEFHRFINSPNRLAVPGDPLDLAKTLESKEKLKPYFHFKSSDFKDAVGFSNKIRGGADNLSAYLRTRINENSLNSCSAAESCTEAAKQALADDLNKIINGESIYSPERFDSNVLSPELNEKSIKFIEKIDAANKKIEKDNKAIDAEIAQATDETQKQEKAKKKKKPITNLFYLNRFLIEDVYQNYLQKSPLEPIRGEDLGVEAIDDYTFRMKLEYPAPYFLALLGHQFFRVVHLPTIEKHGKAWTKPENIVTSGAFHLSVHYPYDKIVAVKNPNYWDAENVKLDRIEFYPLEEATTMMNLYKAGSVDAVYNHVVPAAWNDEVKQYKDEYLNHPEVAIEYYTFNVKKGPTSNVKVRKAFALAVDREALSKFRKTTKPLTDFTPEGIFPKYEEARKKVYGELLKENNISEEEWKARMFNPAKACQLMRESGYQVTDTEGGRCRVTNFPVEEVNITYNTSESNKATAEFVQAQWKQNLGITVPLKNMEWKTFLPVRKAVDYLGMARAGWVGDYMDPNTFLKLFYGANNDSSTGYYDPKFDQMMIAANSETNPQKRLEMLARAEFYMMQSQPVVPLQTQATNWIKKPYVKGLYPNPGTLHPWKFVYIERDPNKWDTNVDNIMTEANPATEAQVEKLMETQTRFEQMKAAETQKNAE